MSDESDETARRQARAEADFRWPPPREGSAGAAVRGALVAAMVLAGFFSFRLFANAWTAGALTLSAAALIQWTDTRGRCKRNTEEFLELYDLYRRRP